MSENQLTIIILGFRNKCRYSTALDYCTSHGVIWQCDRSRDVTNFVSAFDNMRILTSFQLFDIWQIVGNISGECEYFILLSLI